MSHTSKPSVYPDFATQDFVDPISGSNNVVEPSPGKKETGWTRHETPPRQYFNWFHRFTGLWIRYADTELDYIFGEIQSILDILGDATSLPTAGTLVQRDGSARFQAADPSAAQDVATRGYVDGAIATAQANATEFASGDRLMFFSTPSPPGWSLAAISNDRSVIIDSTDIGGFGGSSWGIGGFTVTGHALTEDEMPSHRHEEGAVLRGGTTAISTAFGTVDTGLNGNVWEHHQFQTLGVRAWTSTEGDGDPHDHGILHNGTWRPPHIKGAIYEKD